MATALHVRAANYLIGERAPPLLSPDRVELDFIAVLNVFVMAMLRAGLSRLLVICDIHRYARVFLAESAKGGLFARADEVWDHADDAVLISGLGLVRSASIEMGPRARASDYDAIVCASCSSVPSIALELSEFDKPGRYAVWIGVDERGRRCARVRGNALEEPESDDLVF